MKPQHGVAIGIVKSLADPDGQGRIELELPWLPGRPRSAWAPIAAALAGSSRGAFLMPEPEDEVLVAFEHGDFAHPFVVGFLWNGADKPPESDPANRVILTPGGHTIRFEDGDGARKVVIRSSARHEVLLDDAAGAGGVRITTAGGLHLHLDDGATPTVELLGGGRRIRMQNGTVEIT